MKNSRFVSAILVLLAVGLIGNALVSWRTIGVVQNDIKHLESLIVDTRDELRDDIRDIRRFFREP